MNVVRLYWLPLGAGGSAVRRYGMLYELASARLERRDARPLFHAALTVELDDETYAIELTPESSDAHGQVARGFVGTRWLGTVRQFRYEVRCWQGGSIPDIEYAVGGPVVLASTRASARQVIRLVPHVPTPVWGRDELRTGEMWNSNSVVSWLIERIGIDATGYRPPNGGRAPGWLAGVRAARR